MMPAHIESHVRQRCDSAQLALTAGDNDLARTLLGEAHVLTQPWPVAHAKVHGQMLRMAVGLKLPGEIWGQAVRLAVAGPASLIGTIPVGNHGWSTISAVQPIPLSADIAELLDGHLPARARLPHPLVADV